MNASAEAVVEVSADLAIPRLKGGFPFLGHTVDFIRDPVTLLQRAYDECGTVAQYLV
ncbi:MAG: hypothetical protein R3A47_03435 [Polyangiales bacterium]